MLLSQHATEIIHLSETNPWLSSHHTKLRKFHGYPATTLSFTSLVAIQPPLTNGQIHSYPATLFKATLTCGLYPATRVSPNMWLSSHQMYLKFNREINRKINREINRNLSVFQGKMLFKNQSEIQSLNFQRKQNLLKKSCFQSKIDFAKKSIVLLIFFNRGAFGLSG